MDQELEGMLDELMADGFMSAVFMLQISLVTARQQQDPKAWARDFISQLHGRMDAHEKTMDASWAGVHEKARTRIDSLGRHLAQLLELPPPSTNRG